MTQKLQKLTALLKKTRFWLVVFAVLGVAVIFIGLDNVPGIVLGYLATAVLMTQWTRRWRRTWHFVVLFFVSVAGIIFLSFLLEVVVFPLAVLVGGSDAALSAGWNIFHVVVSLIIAFVGGTGLFIGLIGAIALGVVRLVALSKRGT